MRNRPRIIVIGSLVFDFVARADRLPRKGETVLGSAFGMFPGGKGANQAVQAGRLGAEVYMIGRIGDDFLGEHVVSSLRESGVNTDYIRRDKSVSTAACCIHVDGRGDNAIIIVPEANMACSREDVDAAGKLIESADILLCQLEIALPAVEYAVSMAARRGVPVILNPAPAQRVPEGLFSNVTILTPNETEAEFFSGIPAPSSGAQTGARTGEPACAPAKSPDAMWEWESKVARKLLAMGPKTVVMTLGERGAYLASDGHEQLLPGYRIAAVDVTAAGDAFNGALAVALAEGRDIDDAIAFANGAGALAAMRAGAQPSLAFRDELEEFLHEALHGARGAR